MKKGWVLTQESLDSLLDWLDPDRERAGYKYETIRIRLIHIFTCRGCDDAEELADETFNRATSKLHEIKDEWQGDPALYCYKIAQYVLTEWRRRANRHVDLPAEDPPTPVVVPGPDDELEYECLMRCMEHLGEAERTLVIEYYQQQGQAKINHHKQMAIAMGIAVNALRIRACRIRRQVKKCATDCVQARSQRNGFTI